MIKLCIAEIGMFRSYDKLIQEHDTRKKFYEVVEGRNRANHQEDKPRQSKSNTWAVLTK